MSQTSKTIAGFFGGLTALVVAAFFYFVYSPVPAEPALSGGIATATIRVGERERSYLAYVPAKLAAGAPLIIVLHGSTMDGLQMRHWTAFEFDRLADANGFVVLYPDGYKGNWNDCRKYGPTPAKKEGIDDVGFINALIARYRDERGVDPAKVYLFGYSNGGTMAFRLAVEQPDRIAGITAVGANLPSSRDESTCPEDGPTSRVMLVAGTQDPISPFEGGEVTLFGFASRGYSISSEATAEAFAQRNGSSAPPVDERLPHRKPDDPTSVDRHIWLRDGRPFVALYVVNGGGHVVPQPGFRFPRILGRTTGDLDAPVAAVDFYGFK